MNRKPRLLRMTTVAMSLRLLIPGQIRNAAKNGFKVFMASSDGKERAEIMELEQTEHQIIDFERDISLLKDLRALGQTINLIRRIKPDIVHTHTPKAGLLGMLGAWLTRRPLRIHTVAGMPLEGMTGIKKKVVWLMEKLTYAAATHVWPNSHSLARYIEEEKLTVSAKITVIGKGSSNGIDLEDYRPDSLDSAILQKVKKSIEYNKDYRYLVFVGRIVNQKGISELITSFQKVQQEVKNLKLVLVGMFEDERDPVPDSIKAIIRENNEIICTGFSPHVKYYMHLAELFIFPSHREGFPNVPIQAGAMLCPVLASRIKGNIDIVKHGKTGLLHETKNEEDLTEKLRFALANPETMQRTAQALRQYIEQNFERKYVQNQIILEYRKLLAETNIT